MIEAELADGTILEFPDGTDPSVVDSVVKKHLGVATNPDIPTFMPGDKESDFTYEKTDSRGIANAIVAGVNKGAIELADLPVTMLNMVLDVVPGVPDWVRSATPSEAVDFLSEKLTGKRPIEMATTPQENVDTPLERTIGRGAQFATESFAGAGALKRFTGVQPNRVKETVSGAGAGLGMGAAEENTDNAALQLAGAVVGGLSSDALMSSARAGLNTVRASTDQFTKAGAERRVGKVLAGATENPEQAINNLQNNPLFIQSVLGENVDARIAVNDPGVQSVLNAAVADNTSLVAKLDEGFNAGLEGVRRRLIEESFQASPSGFIERTGRTIVQFVDSAKNALNQEILYIDNLITKVESDFGSGRIPSNVSTEFQSALDSSYQRARTVSRDLWERVDYVDELDVRDLKKRVKRARAQLKADGVAVNEFPDDLYSVAGQFGKKKGPKGFKGLSGYLSSVLDAKRAAEAAGNNSLSLALGKLENELKDMLYSSGGDARTAAADFTRRMYDAYDSRKLGRYLRGTTQGTPVIDPETVLDKIVNPGANVGDIRRVVELERNPVVEGQNVNLVSKIEEYVKNKFIGLTSTARDGFITKHKDLLANMPTLGRDLSAIQQQLSELSERIAQKRGMVSSIDTLNKAKIQALTGSDSLNIYDKLSRLSTEDLMAIKRVAEIDGALPGMQSVFLREMSSNLLQGKEPGELTRLLNTNDKMRFVFENILSNEQRANLRKIEKANSVIKSVSDGSSRKVGSMFQGTLLTQLLARVGGVQLSGAVGGGAGSIQRAAIFSQTARALVNRLPSTHAQAVIEKAALDPKYMAKLMKKGLEGATPKEVEDTLRLWLLEAGVAVEEDDDV